MYQPNFCAECGTKILRLRWHIWTSRRFCAPCARQLRRVRLTPVLFACLALICAGYVAGRVRRPLPPPLVIQRRSDSPLTDNQTTPRLDASPAGTRPTGPQPETAVEDVYTCGARTKKGTPCSRRVHGPVRCWQHKGMPAMLPQEKLLVKD